MPELCKVKMKLNEPKKHSVRYDCDEQGTGLTSIYLSKSVLPLNNPPKEITVTVSDE